MTGYGYLIAAVLMCAAALLGLLAGLRMGSTDQDSYWQGFAEGELHGRLDERHPSPN